MVFYLYPIQFSSLSLRPVLPQSPACSIRSRYRAFVVGKLQYHYQYAKVDFILCQNFILPENAYVSICLRMNARVPENLCIDLMQPYNCL